MLGKASLWFSDLYLRLLFIDVLDVKKVKSLNFYNSYMQTLHAHEESAYNLIYSVDEISICYMRSLSKVIQDAIIFFITQYAIVIELIGYSQFLITHPKYFSFLWKSRDLMEKIKLTLKVLQSLHPSTCFDFMTLCSLPPTSFM